MSFTVTWDSAFEGTPPGSGEPGKVKYGDDRIREVKESVRERLAVEHDWGVAGTEDCRHKIPRVVTGSLPTDVVDGAFGFDTTLKSLSVYNGSAWKPAGVGDLKMVHYGATAPGGWTLNADLNNHVIYVDNSAGGTKTGTVDAKAGTMTGFSTVAAGDHSHTVDSHRHSIPVGARNFVGNPSYTALQNDTWSGYTSPGTDTQGDHSHTITHGTFNFKIALMVCITKDSF